MNSDKQYTINPKEVAWRIIDGEAYILDLNKGNYYTLDKIGTEMWCLLSEKMKFKDIAKKIMNNYDGEEKAIEEDLAHFIHKLKKKGLVHHERGV